MLICFTQPEQKAALGPLSEGAVAATGGDWGSVLPLKAHPLHRFAVPLPLRGRQEVRFWFKSISVILNFSGTRCIQWREVILCRSYQRMCP